MADFVISNNLKVHGTIKDSSDVVVTGAPSVEVSKNSAAAVGERRTLNLIEGANVTLTIVDDAGGDEIDVTIAAAGAATKGYDVTLTTANVNLNAIASTTIISVTEIGRVVGIAFKNLNPLGASGTANLDLTVDGGTKRSFTIYPNSSSWIPGDFGGWISDDAWAGEAADDRLSIPFNFTYAVSLLIAVDVTNVFASGDTLKVFVLKGVEL